MKRSSFLPGVLSLAVFASAETPVEGQWTNRYPKVQEYNHHVYVEGYELPILTNGPIDPAIAPDGTTIAFASRGWIWTADLRTGEATRLTRGRDIDSRPAWSPDGEAIAFVRDNDHDLAIVVVDAATGVERLHIDSPAIDMDPAFSPDGSELYFVSGRSGSLDLWAHDMAAGSVRAVTTGAGMELRPQPGEEGLLHVVKGGVDRIVWRSAPPVDPNGEVRGRTLGIELAKTNIASLLRPALSPDGDLVAYGWPTQEGWELRLLRIDDPGPSILLHGDANPLTPAWSPDGQWIYFSESDENQVMRLRRVGRGGGPIEDIRFRAMDWGEETATLRIRTHVDGDAAPARLNVLDRNGHPAVPDRSMSWFDGQNGRVFFYTDGSIELTVPAGEVSVSAVQGLTTPEARVTASAMAGSVTTIDLDLSTVWDAASAGWMSAEHHFHLNYGGQYVLHPSDLVPVMRGENLDASTPLLANLHNRFGDQHLWRWEQAGSGPLIRFGQEVRSHFLGHLGLIETQKLFWPWVWGPGYEVYGEDDRENAEVLDFTRSQGGFGYYVHPVASSDPFGEGGVGTIPVELVADAVLGDLDGLEVVCLWSDELGTADVWYRFLNLGIPVAASAGSDVMTDFHRTMAVGTTRVYANTNGARNWRAYMDALQEGRTFVTNGPMIEFDVSDVGPGGVVQAGDVEFRAVVRSASPFDRVELLVNGDIVAGRDGLSEAGELMWDGSLTLPEGGWIALRALGGETVWPSMDSYPFAHSSPIWIGARGSTLEQSRVSAANDLLRALDNARLRLDTRYGEADIPRLTARFEAARERLESFAGSR